VIKATNARLVEMAMPPRVLDADVRLTFGPGKLCWVCEKYPVVGHPMYCPLCLRLVKRTTGASEYEQAAALANRMKTDTDEQEWHAYYRMLDIAMRGGVFEREKLTFKYWKRYY
jgi:hypothetical protein